MVASAILLGALGLAVGTAGAATPPLPVAVPNANRLPAGRMEDGVYVLRLELRETLWRPESDDPHVPSPDARTPAAIPVAAIAEAGHAPRIPGPLIRVPQGTAMRVSVRNLLPHKEFVHGLGSHGAGPAAMMELAPGEMREARFDAGAPGTYLYWASTQPGTITDEPNFDGPMSGAFVVDATAAPPPDRIFVLQMWDAHPFQRDFKLVFAINGKSWPYTERIQARVGQAEFWRVVNASGLAHPMHLHGFFYTVTAVGDGQSMQFYPPAERRLVVTESVPPGHTFEMKWVPARAGNWLFHCHIMDHMSAWTPPILYGGQAAAGSAATPRSGAMAAMDGAAPGKDGGGQRPSYGMAGLVLGIHVSGGAAPSTALPVSARWHLYVRERPARNYVPAGPGFFLAGVSHEVGAIGPPLVLVQGRRAAITITNQLQEPTAVHWHGLEIESYYDGVPGWDGTSGQTTPAIAPGQSFTAYLTPPRAGTFIYHTHWHDIEQLTGGLYGALLVLPPGQKYDPAADKVFVIGRSGPNVLRDPLVVNGSPEPPVQFLQVGRRYRLRFINITPTDEPLTVTLRDADQLARWRAIAKDGADLPAPQATVRDAKAPVSVGSTSDFEFKPARVGLYSLQFSSNDLVLGAGEVTVRLFAVPGAGPLSGFLQPRN